MFVFLILKFELAVLCKVLWELNWTEQFTYLYGKSFNMKAETARPTCKTFFWLKEHKTFTTVEFIWYDGLWKQSDIKHVKYLRV